MRMRTATNHPSTSQGSGGRSPAPPVWIKTLSNDKPGNSATPGSPDPRQLPFLLALLLAFLGPLLGALAVAGADLGLEHLGPRHEGAGPAHAGDHLQPLPHAHLGHLPHDD